MTLEMNKRVSDFDSVESDASKNHVDQHDTKNYPRGCGTHLLRRGLESMSAVDRENILQPIGASGLLPEI